MKIPFSDVQQSRKLESAISITVLLFIFKILFYSADTYILFFFNELLVFGSLYLWTLYIIDFIHPKANSPLSIFLNIGILTALIFFILAISTAAFEQETISNSSFVTSFFSLIFSLVFFGASIYIFTAFRELFFLRQKRDPKTYYNTMMVFFVLVFFSNLLIRINPDFDYPKNAFYVVTIVLISINSLRVAWIAFLPKRQKISLLVLSVILSVLFGFNFALTLEGNILTTTLMNFSAGFLSVLNLLMIYGTIYCGVIFFTALFHLPTAEAFDRKAQEVTSLMDLTKLITQVLDFKELANSITQITTKVCNSDSAWLIIVNEDNEYELASVNNIGYIEAESLSRQILKDNEEDINSLISISPGNYNVAIRNDLRKFKFNWIVIAPLNIHDQRKGYLFAARIKDFSFDEDDKKAIEAFSDYASVSLENAKLIEESIEKERLEKELDVARDIQYKILPYETPRVDKLEISALFVPAFEVGGDYYDFFEIDKDNLAFVIADVSGKGISAAFIMAEIKGIFESLARTYKSPKEVLIKANEILNNSLEKKSFVTAIYGLINLPANKLVFARCGHSPLILVRDNKAERLTPPGIGLGLDDGPKFTDTLKEMEIELNNNDILALYTDGVTESQNAKQEDFGYERFEKIIISNANAETDLISNKIMEQLTTFSQDNVQHDDITLVIFKMKFNNKTSGVS